MNKGIISLTVVIFMMVIMVLILALLQSRILLAIQRTKGTADSILSTYNAESKIYDTLAKIDLDVPVDLNPGPQTLADGTVLEFEGHDVGNERIITITAKLPFATTKLEISQKKSASVTSYGNVDIVFALDCTGSMQACADGHDENECWLTGNPPTRIEALREAVVNFLTKLRLSPGSESVRVGIGTFTSDARWLTLSDGTPIKPDKNLDIQEVIDRVETAFVKLPWESDACKNIFANGSFQDGGTSPATGLQFNKNYFSATKTGTNKQIQIMVTDGLPTTAIPITACGTQYFIPGNKDDMGVCPEYQPSYFSTYDSSIPTRWQCKPDVLNNPPYVWSADNANPDAQNNFACMIADSNTQWKAGATGQRDPEVDSYVLLTFPLAPTNPIKSVFPTYPGVEVYDMANANELSDILEHDVLGTIQTTIDELRIRRVIP